MAGNQPSSGPQVRVRVTDGTRSDAQPCLCRTCAYATVMRGAADSAEDIYCSSVGNRKLSMRVVDCSDYRNKSTPSLSTLYQTAWILESDKTQKKMGFVPYKQWRKTNQDDDDAHY